MTADDEIERKINQMKKKAENPQAGNFISKVVKRFVGPKGGTEEMDEEGDLLKQVIPVDKKE